VEGEESGGAETLEFVDGIEVDGTLPEDGELLGSGLDGGEVLQDGVEGVARFSGFVEELGEESGVRGDDVARESLTFEVRLVELSHFSRGSVATDSGESSCGDSRDGSKTAEHFYVSFFYIYTFEV
jgi:hypothetical protein